MRPRLRHPIAPRAAALPEYALVFAILLGASLALYDALATQAEVTVQDSASAIGALPTIDGFDATADHRCGTTPLPCGR